MTTHIARLTNFETLDISHPLISLLKAWGSGLRELGLHGCVALTDTRSRRVLSQPVYACRPSALPSVEFSPHPLSHEYTTLAIYWNRLHLQSKVLRLYAQCYYSTT